MFNWVVKVVPHPSSAQDAPGESTPVNGKTTNQERVKSSKAAGEEDQASQTSQGSVQSGMLNWLSSGFASTLPQPAGSPLITRATDFKGDERPGVIGWISQGIGKVVPQPDIYEKYTREQTPESEEVTEVYDINDLPDLEPLPHIPVVELLSEDEDEEDTRTTPTVATWIKNGFQNAMPHHVPRPPSGSVPSTPRSSQCSNKIYSPPPESIASVTELDSNPPSVVGWIVHGLGLSMPQPVLKLRDEYLDDGKMLHNGGKTLRTP